MKALFRNESNRADLIPALAALVAAMMALLLTTPRILAANMSDGFESYATGYLDSNTAGGPNTGSSNPWWGPNPANFRVTGAVNGVTAAQRHQDDLDPVRRRRDRGGIFRGQRPDVVQSGISALGWQPVRPSRGP
jgi:predicted cobalt transporter CbtA